MNSTLNEWLSAEPERDRLFAQEQLIVAVAENIWEQMENRRISKAEIASALSKSKAFVTQVLNGTRNMTLRTLSDIAFALDAELEIQFRPKSSSSGWSLGMTTSAPTAVVCEQTVRHNAVNASPHGYLAEAA
jgi:antitoxin component HigA of HigAB toxin-antitoxin module